VICDKCQSLERERDELLDEAIRQRTRAELAEEQVKKYVGAWDKSIVTREAAERRCVELEKLLDEVRWLCDGREDIDGAGGPNLAMQIQTAIGKLK
jgi:hypothetical protein